MASLRSRVMVFLAATESRPTGCRDLKAKNKITGTQGWVGFGSPLMGSAIGKVA